MLLREERPVRVFIGKHLSLRGGEVKLTVLNMILVGSRKSQVQLSFGKSSILHSLSWIDRSWTDPPKTQFKAGRRVQENTRQYREVGKRFCVVFTFYLPNFCNLCVGERPVGLVH